MTTENFWRFYRFAISQGLLKGTYQVDGNIITIQVRPAYELYLLYCHELNQPVVTLEPFYLMLKSCPGFIRYKNTHRFPNKITSAYSFVYTELPS